MKLRVFHFSDRGLASAALRLREQSSDWAYIGSDFRNERRAVDILGDLGRVISGGPLNEIADELRQDYIDYVGRLSQDNDSLLWWESRISEKQPHLSTFFQNLCLLERAKRLLGEEREVVLVVDGYQLYRAVAAAAGHGSSLSAKLASSFRGLAHYLELPARRAYFVLSQWRRIAVARSLLRGYYGRGLDDLRSRPVILLHSWVDERSFPALGKFKDSYFGGLLDTARRRNLNLAVLPYVLSTVDYPAALRNVLEATEQVFIVPHYFMTWLDPIRLAIVNLPAAVRHRAPLFNGEDVGSLIVEDINSDRFNHRICHDRFYHHLPGRLKRWGIEVERLIYPFENQTWEKDILLGLRSAYPAAVSVGYQHSSYSRLTLNYFISELEKALTPVPDKLLATGPRPAALLAETFGCPTEVGGAVRYPDLFVSRESRTIRSCVLVATSIEIEESAELLSKCVEAFDGTDLRVLVKCHPVLPYERLAEFLNIAGLPPGFEVSGKPPVELFNETAIIIYTATTVALEGLAAGIPVLQVPSTYGISADPLADFPGAILTASSSLEITRQTYKILGNFRDVVEGKKDLWRDLICLLFSEPSEAGYERFFCEK